MDVLHRWSIWERVIFNFFFKPSPPTCRNTRFGLASRQSVTGRPMCQHNAAQMAILRLPEPPRHAPLSALMWTLGTPRLGFRSDLGRFDTTSFCFFFQIDTNTSIHSLSTHRYRVPILLVLFISKISLNTIMMMTFFFITCGFILVSNCHDFLSSIVFGVSIGGWESAASRSTRYLKMRSYRPGTETC